MTPGLNVASAGPAGTIEASVEVGSLIHSEPAVAPAWLTPAAARATTAAAAAKLERIFISYSLQCGRHATGKEKTLAFGRFCVNSFEGESCLFKFVSIGEPIAAERIAQPSGLRFESVLDGAQLVDLDPHPVAGLQRSGRLHGRRRRRGCRCRSRRRAPGS